MITSYVDVIFIWNIFLNAKREKFIFTRSPLDLLRRITYPSKIIHIEPLSIIPISTNQHQWLWCISLKKALRISTYRSFKLRSKKIIFLLITSRIRYSLQHETFNQYTSSWNSIEIRIHLVDILPEISRTLVGVFSFSNLGSSHWVERVS